MEAVFNPVPRSTVVPVRPKSTMMLDRIKYGHSQALTKHRWETTDKHGPRHSYILQQRYVGYPVSVPDLSKEATAETLSRRAVHKELCELDEKAFRRKFYPECTSDVFHQKHLVRDYLTSMHPYSDPLDHGRTYNMSRLKARALSRGEPIQGNQERDGERGGGADFLNPEDPTRPRSVGYSKGHVRNMLKLDAYGEHSSEVNRIQRELGLLPESPNVDRYRNSSPLSSSNSRASTADSSAGGSPIPRRPKTTGHVGTIDDYRPLHPPRGRLGGAAAAAAASSAESLTDAFNLAESGSFAVLGIVGSTPPDAHRQHQSGMSTKQRGVDRRGVPPGTLGYTGPAIVKEDITLIDPMSRGQEYYKSIIAKKQQKINRKQALREEATKTSHLKREAMDSMDSIDAFENHLRVILSKPRPL